MSDTHPANFDRTQLIRVVEKLDLDDLRWLNSMIVERLKLLDQAHSTANLAQLNIGDRVSFTDNAGSRKTGAVIKLNKKTASILTDDKQRWNVSPHFLEPIS